MLVCKIHQGGKASLAFFPTALSGIPVSGAGVLELWRRAGATGLLLLLVRMVQKVQLNQIPHARKIVHNVVVDFT